MPDTDDTLHSIEAYSFRQNYLLSQMIHLHVAGSFFLIGLASGSLSTFMMVCVPGLTTAMLGYVRYQLHRMEDHVRAHQIGAQICLVAGAATVPLANVLGSTMREVLRQQVSFMLFYWLNFMTFAVWVQINAIPVRRRLGLFVWIAVVCIATPSWSALSEAEELCALAIIFSASELIGHALRQQHRMTQAFRLEAVSQRMGDSRLNHVIKNSTPKRARTPDQQGVGGPVTHAWDPPRGRDVRRHVPGRPRAVAAQHDEGGGRRGRGGRGGGGPMRDAAAVGRGDPAAERRVVPPARDLRPAAERPVRLDARADGPSSAPQPGRAAPIVPAEQLRSEAEPRPAPL